MSIHSITNFKILTDSPIDDRMLFPSYSTVIQTFEEHPNWLYEGLITYVIDTQSIMVYKGDQWATYTSGLSIQADAPLRRDNDTIKINLDDNTLYIDENGSLATRFEDHFVGWFNEPTDLPETGKTGQYAVVVSTGTFWIWDVSEWIDSHTVGSGVISIVTRNGGIESGTVEITPQKIGAIPDTVYVGDMSTSIYDTDYDGIVDASKIAEQIYGIENAAPNQYYGKNANGIIGFHTITGTGGVNCAEAVECVRNAASAVAFTGSYTDLVNTPVIPKELSELRDDPYHMLITSDEREYWNSKQDSIGVDTSLIELKTNKGSPDGYVPLDINGKIPSTYIPSSFTSEYMTVSKYDNDLDGSVNYADKILGIDDIINSAFYGVIDGIPGFYEFASQTIEINTKWGSITGILNDQIDLVTALDTRVPITRVVYVKRFDGSYVAYELSSDIYVDVPTQLSQLTIDNEHNTVTQEQITYWNNKQEYIGYPTELIEIKLNKGIANGYAPLGSDGKVPYNNLPNLQVNNVYVIDCENDTFPTNAIVSDLVICTNSNEVYIYTGSEWASTSMVHPGGIVAIDLPSGQQTGPIVYITKNDLELGNVTNDAQMVATTGVQPNTIPIWADEGKTLKQGYTVVHSIGSGDPTKLVSEQGLTAILGSFGSGYIRIINGKTGESVTLTKSDIGLSKVVNELQMFATEGVTPGTIPIWLNDGTRLTEGYGVNNVLSVIGTDTKLVTDKAVRDALNEFSSTGVIGTVKSVNSVLPGIDGDVYITKSNIGLSNVTNDTQMVATSGMQVGSIPKWADNGRTLTSGYTVSDVISASPSTSILLSEFAIHSLLENIDIVVDSAFSTVSVQPVENRLITNALQTKVDKVYGKGLSTNDLTNELLNKLNGIESGAEQNVQSDWNETDDTLDTYINNKPGIVSSSSYGFLPQYDPADIGKFLKIGNSSVEWTHFTAYASQVIYSPSSTTLTSTNVQSAIDELWSTKITDYLPTSYAWVGDEDNHAIPQLVATLPNWISGKYLKSTSTVGTLEFATLEIPEYPWYLRNDGGNTPISNISWNNNKLTNLKYGTATTDAANIQNVRDEINGFYWKAPVNEINDTPEPALPYTLVAHTDGTIYEYNEGWNLVYTAREGNVIYDKNTQKMYFWNGTSWQQIVGTGGTSNAIVADGSVKLINNWNINDGTHTYTLQGVPDPVNDTDVSNKNFVVNSLLNLAFQNPVVMMESNENEFNESIASIGDRYIIYPEGDIKEKTGSSTWKTITPKTGAILYNKADGHMYTYTGVMWTRFEQIIDGSLLDLTFATLDHASTINREFPSAHPQYVLKSGDSITGNISLSNVARIRNMPSATQDGDAVNFAQLKAYANGAVWQTPVKGVYNTPPSNPEEVGRVIVGPNPTGVFVNHEHDIAQYNIGSSTWSFTDPVKGWSVLCQSDGELNNAQDQFSFNGTEWSLFFTGQTHDQLIGAADSAIHTRYLRSDEADTAEALITFNPNGTTVPFIIPSSKNGVVTNLNANLLNGYTQNTSAIANSLALRTANGSLNVTNIIGTGTSDFNSGILRDEITSSTSYVESINVGSQSSPRWHHYLRYVPSACDMSFVTFAYDVIMTNAGEVLTTASTLDADLLGGHDSSWYMKSSAVLSDLIDVSGTPSANQILGYDAVASQWVPMDGPSISSSNHDALIGLHYINDNVEDGIADDHPQYLNNERYINLHNTTSAHSLGTIIPHDTLNGLTDVSINDPQQEHLLVYRDGEWINAFANAFMFIHDSMNMVDTSIGHQRYLHIGDKNDSSNNKLLGNLSIGNIVAENYIPFSGSSTYNWNDFRNMTINLGQFTTVSGYTTGSWGKDGLGRLNYGGSTGFRINVNTGYTNGSFHDTYHTLAFGASVSELSNQNGFIVKVNNNTVLRAYADVNDFTYNGYKVWHEGCTKDYSHGGALSGLNADTLWGMYPSELMNGGTIIHANVLNNVINQANNGISDDHPQYLTFGYSENGFTSSNRHANTALHAIGTVVPKPKFETEIDGISISNKGIGDFLSWNGTNWVNAQVNITNINHDNIANGDSSAHDTRYIRKNATQFIDNLLTFTGVDIDTTGNYYYVPFTLASRGDWQTVQYLDADKVDGWHADSFAFKAVNQTISGINTFTNKVSITNDLRIPQKTSSYIPEEERELYLNQDNGFLYYTWKNALNEVVNLQVPVSSASGASNISGTVSDSFFIGDISGLYLHNESNELAVRNHVGALTSIKGKDIYVGSSSGNPVKITDTTGSTPAIINTVIDGGDLTW